MRPLVSVVIPCFNGERFVAEAIESALAQTYRPLEVIVVDDGSTDRSSGIIDSFAPRVKVVRQRNAGLPAARNAGIRASRGAFLAFLDCDDYWSPDFAASMVTALEKSAAAIAYCGWQNIGLPGRKGEPFIPPEYEGQPDKLLLLVSASRWPVHAAVVRREVANKVGGFDSRWTSCEDFAFWLRAATSHALVRVPSVLAFYRHHGEGQMTRRRGRIAHNCWLVQREFLREHPAAAAALGSETVRRITHGALLERGYACYWNRDLESAHYIFRRVMMARYGSSRDWKYLLPSLLPIAAYRRLVEWLDRRKARFSGTTTH